MPKRRFVSATARIKSASACRTDSGNSLGVETSAGIKTPHPRFIYADCASGRFNHMHDSLARDDDHLDPCPLVVGIERIYLGKVRIRRRYVADIMQWLFVAETGKDLEDFRLIRLAHTATPQLRNISRPRSLKRDLFHGGSHTISIST